MKLSEFPDKLFKIISNEEKDLEREVENAVVQVSLQNGEDIILHSWEYEKKKEAV